MLVYLDTNIWIYAYENDPVYGDPARQFLQKLRNGPHKVAGSLFVLGELLVLPTRKGNTFALASYRRLFSSPELTLLAYTLPVVQLYATLRADYRLRPLDSLHLATAAAHSVDLFVTQDSDILALATQGIAGIGGWPTHQLWVAHSCTASSCMSGEHPQPAPARTL